MLSPRSVCLFAVISALFLAATDARAALTLSVEMGPDRVRPTEPVNIQFTVANDGAAPVVGVVLQAPVPTSIASFNPALLTNAGTCIVSVSNNGLCDATEVMNWNLGTIPANSSVTVSVAMFVAAATPAGTILALNADLQAGTILANASITVSTDNALMLAVDDALDPVAAGAQLTYTLTYGNRSNLGVSGATLSFPLPAGTTFVSATGGGVLNGGNVQWAIGDLPATQSGQQQVVVSVGAGLVGGSVLQVDGAVLDGTSSVAETARADAVTSVASQALGLAIEINPDPVRPGEWTTAQLTVTNRTANAIFNATLLARMPDGISDFNEATIIPTTTCVAGISNNALCDAQELASWLLGTLPAGGAVTVSVPLPVNAATTAGRLLTLAARVTGDGARETSARQSVAVDGDHLLTLSVDENIEPIAPGAPLTYTLTYGNRSTTASTSTALSFPLPVGATFVSATGGGTLVGNRVEWALGNLPAGQSDQQQVVVNVGAGLTSGALLVVDTALLSGQGVVSESARATAATSIAASRVLGLGVELNPDPVRPAEWTLAQVTVSNLTANAVFGTALSVRMPLGISGFSPSVATGAGTCIAGISNNSLCDAIELGTWALGTLPAGGSVVVSIPLPIFNGTAAGRLLTLETRVTDDSTHQALVRQTASVDADQPLNLAVDEDLDPVPPGGVLTYTLTYANRSTNSVTGAALSFPVPAGTTFLSATGGGVLSGGKVQWALGTLPATQSDQQQVMVAVNGGLGAGSILLSDASVLSGTGVLAESTRATAVSAVGAPTLGIAVEVTPDPVRPNEWAMAEVTVSNRTLANAFGVVLQARVPQGLNSFNPALLTAGGGCVASISNDALCNSVERAIWNLGTLVAGGSTHVSIPLPVNSATTAGRLLALETLVNDDSAHQSTVKQTIAVDSDHPLTLSIDEDLDAVPAGGLLTYSLTYGNRSTGAITGATLSFPLPAQATFAGSTGGTASGGRLTWNLGTIAAGTGGRRKVFLNVPGGVPAGSILLANEAVLRGTGLATEVSRSVVATAVEAAKPLGLELTFGRDPTQASAALTSTFRVTNNSAASVSGVVLEARIPVSVGTFSPALLTSGGTCIVGISNDGLCNPVERASWALGTLLPGASTNISVPMAVIAGLANGRLMYLDARLTDDLARISTQSRTALVAPFVDGDADMVADIYDNCPFFANVSQTDTDLDGRGNDCECGDQSGDGRNTVSDLVAINLAIFNPGQITPLCDANNDGQCNVNDIIAANLEIFSPTSTSTCGRQPVPGP